MADFSTDTTFLNDLFGGGQTFDIPGIDWAGLFGGSNLDWANGSGLTPTLGTQQTYYLDTQNPDGQKLTLAQVQAIDPSFTGMPIAGGPPSLNTGTGLSGAETPTPQGGINMPGGTQPSQAQLSTLESILKLAPGTLAALSGLGLLGASGAALLGHGNQPGTATRTETIQSNALSNPAVQQLLGTPGTSTGGGTAGGPPSYQGGTGLQGAAGQASSNLQGPGGLLQGQINAIPQLNPAIQAAIGQNALGFSQGNVPTLNNPQAQQYFQNMLGGQNAAVDYQTGNSLTDAIQSLRSRGFAGGSEIFREGAPAAAMGPIVAQANAQKAMNLGNINSQQLNYATGLPMLGSQLNTAQLGQQGVPFSAYTTAAQTQSQIPQTLLQALMGERGSSSTQTSTGASPNFLQTLKDILPILGSAGVALGDPSLTGSAGVAGRPATPSLYAQYTGLFGGG